jgi:hypothetical protein
MYSAPYYPIEQIHYSLMVFGKMFGGSILYKKLSSRPKGEEIDYISAFRLGNDRQLT